MDSPTDSLSTDEEVWVSDLAYCFHESEQCAGTNARLEPLYSIVDSHRPCTNCTSPTMKGLYQYLLRSD